ncbi:hypothetical protein [Blastococcus sp. SYSU DS0539]
MSWWGWLLVGWAIASVAGSIVVGMAIRTADRRDLRRDRADEWLDPRDEDAA